MIPIKPLIFTLLSIMVIVPAIMVVTLRNIFHCALFLVLSLTGVAGLFALMGADFIFIAQILVYAGGITVLMLFVVLLSGSPKDWFIHQVNGHWWGALIISSGFLTILTGLFRHISEKPDAAQAFPTTESLGFLIIRDLVLPFEAISLVLLSALVGAVLFSKKDESTKKEVAS